MKNLKVPVLVAFCLVSIFNANSQDLKPSKNSLYLEVLGNGGLYSINYERQISPKFYGRIGFSTFTLTDFFGDRSATGTRVTTFPILGTYISGNGKSHFEIAGGMLFGLETEPNSSYKIIDLIAFIGYRYQPPEGGFIFRIGLTPFYSLDNDADYPDTGYLTSAGISFGYHF